MKAAIFMLLALLVLTVAATTAAAQTQVFVPGNASGFFGNPVNLMVPLVSAITVSGPSWIIVTYVSGKVDFGAGFGVGPNGVTFTQGYYAQIPLQEAAGVSAQISPKEGALIGVFVPQWRVQQAGFSALDGTKNVTPAGIRPSDLFFIGRGKTFRASEAGTLFLGINDNGVVDNSGGFNVTVSAQ